MSDATSVEVEDVVGQQRERELMKAPPSWVEFACVFESARDNLSELFLRWVRVRYNQNGKDYACTRFAMESSALRTR